MELYKQGIVSENKTVFIRNLGDAYEINRNFCVTELFIIHWERLVMT